MATSSGPKLFALIYKEGPAFGGATAAQALQDHASHINSLRVQGILLQGGPFGDQVHSWPVVYAADTMAAQALVAADPAVVSTVLQADVFPWNIVFGIHPGI